MTDPAVDADAFNAFEAAGWDQRSAAYNDFFGPITSRVADPLLDAAGVGAGARVLDVASGPGYVTARAAGRGASVAGVDVAASMVALARRLHPELEFGFGDAEALPFEDGSFDAVVANFLLLHLGRPERAAAEFARVLAPAGRVALTVWDLPARARFVGVLVDALAEVGAAPPPSLPAGPPIFRFSDAAELGGLAARRGARGGEGRDRRLLPCRGVGGQALARPDGWHGPGVRDRARPAGRDAGPRPSGVRPAGPGVRVRRRAGAPGLGQAGVGAQAGLMAAVDDGRAALARGSWSEARARFAEALRRRRRRRRSRAPGSPRATCSTRMRRSTCTSAGTAWPARTGTRRRPRGSRSSSATTRTRSAGRPRRRAGSSAPRCWWRASRRASRPRGCRCCARTSRWPTQRGRDPAVRGRRRRSRSPTRRARSTSRCLRSPSDGLALVSSGEIEPGMRRLDAAAAAAVGGEMTDADSIETVCCHMIDACKLVRDLERATGVVPARARDRHALRRPPDVLDLPHRVRGRAALARRLGARGRGADGGGGGARGAAAGS